MQAVTTIGLDIAKSIFQVHGDTRPNQSKTPVVDFTPEQGRVLGEDEDRFAGKTLMTHATEFISEISTFLVETHEVV